MRILYCLQALSPLSGGGESLFYNLAKKMKKRRHDISIICYASKNPEMEVQELKSLGVNIYTVKPEIGGSGPSLFTYKQHLGYMMNAMKVGYQLIKQNHVDIIHANTYTPILPAILLGKILKVPVVSTVHHVSLKHWKLWSSQQGTPFEQLLLVRFMRDLSYHYLLLNFMRSAVLQRKIYLRSLLKQM
jgi:glycosyltransferase involved in cell wall biosynthesis